MGDEPAERARVYVFAAGPEAAAGPVDLGGRPDWVTFTPDSKLLYIATENTDIVVAIDVAARKEIAQHQGGQVAEAQHHVGGAWHELGATTLVSSTLVLSGLVRRR